MPHGITLSSMVTANVTATTLEDLYAQLVAAQKKAHGDDYCLHHAVIRECAKTCTSYLELGVRQGTTLACAVLAGFGDVTGVDRDLGPFRPYEWLFDRAPLLPDLYERDSREPFPWHVDFLFIDSLHTGAHLHQELKAHAPQVRRFILIHDTEKHVDMRATIACFVRDSGGSEGRWRIDRHETRNVGFTLLCRAS